MRIKDHERTSLGEQLATCRNSRSSVANSTFKTRKKMQYYTTFCVYVSFNGLLQAYTLQIRKLKRHSCRGLMKMPKTGRSINVPR